MDEICQATSFPVCDRGGQHRCEGDADHAGWHRCACGRYWPEQDR